LIRLRRIVFLELEQISADFENYHFEVCAYLKRSHGLEKTKPGGKAGLFV